MNENTILYPYKSINDWAEKISYEHKITDFSNNKDNLFEFVDLLGGKIVYNNEIEWALVEKQALQINGENDFTVHFNKYTGPLRDRFVLGHELGHYFIHSKQGQQKLSMSRRSEGIAEFQANWFACGLLMPTNEFLQICEQYDNDNYSIAGRFMVPLKVVEMRKKILAKNGNILKKD